MKATDFRVGNYIVDYEAEPEVSVYWKVEQIANHKFGKKLGLIYRNGSCWTCDPEPIELTEEWLLKLGFDNWGKGTLYNNEFETYDRYVLHNVLDGTSNFEVHYIKSTYGGKEHYEFIISCDEDERINWGNEIKYVHQLQNLYFFLNELEFLIK